MKNIKKEKWTHPENKPKILIFDIETKPILGNVWSIWEQNLGLNMLEADQSILSWSAKWLGAPPEDTMYSDIRKTRSAQDNKDFISNVEKELKQVKNRKKNIFQFAHALAEARNQLLMDDREILRQIWLLLDEADIVLTQNGISFDVKKLNARFILNGMQPPSPYKHIDTKRIASRNFAFTSNKLEYMTDKLCVKYKKLKHGEFGGFDLWKECMKGNLKAWEEMEKYNRYDVLSLEELHQKLQAWDTSPSANFAPWKEGENEAVTECECGSSEFIKKGFSYTATGKFQRIICKKCGKARAMKENLLSKEKRKSLTKKA